jgi:hypothetical protein
MCLRPSPSTNAKSALKGEAPIATTPLWKLVNPYRGLEAMTEANADYFYGRTGETLEVLSALANAPTRLLQRNCLAR